MSEGFITDVDTVLRFFKLCQRFKIKDEATRLLLMRKFVKRKKAKYIPHPEQWLKDKRIRRIDNL